MRERMKDITGQRFGRLVAISRIDYPEGSFWRCLCDCGKTTEVYGGNLKKASGTKSCGCLKRERMAKMAKDRGLLHKGKSISEWAREKGIKKSTLYHRIRRRGWDYDRAINTPVQVKTANCDPNPSDQKDSPPRENLSS